MVSLAFVVSLAACGSPSGTLTTVQPTPDTTSVAAPAPSSDAPSPSPTPDPTPQPDPRLSTLDSLTFLDPAAFPRVVSTPIVTEVPQVSGETPSVDVLTGLNEQVSAQVAEWISAFQASTPDPTAHLTIGWHLLAAAGEYLGIELTSAITGPQASTNSVSYLTHTTDGTVLSCADVISEAGMDLITTMMSTHATGGPGTTAPALTVADIRSLTFAPTGELQLTVADGRGESRWQVDAATTPSVLTEAGAAVQQTIAAGTEFTLPRAPVDCSVEKCIALTFDDGPDEYTEALVNALVAKDAPATFFMLGLKVPRWPDVARLVVDSGFQVCTHAWSHYQLSKMTPDEVAWEINHSVDVIAETTGHRVDCFRPPYGEITPTIKSVSPFPIYLWNNDTEDWKNQNAAETLARALEAAVPGGIIIMHDTWPSTIEQIPQLVDELRALGYHLVTIDELFGGLDLQPGQVIRFREPPAEPAAQE